MGGPAQAPALRCRLQTSPEQLLGLIYCQRLRRSATGRTAARHVGTRRRHLLFSLVYDVSPLIHAYEKNRPMPVLLNCTAVAPVIIILMMMMMMMMMMIDVCRLHRSPVLGSDT